MIREHDRGRSLHDILEDKYVVNRLPSPEQRARLLDRPEIIHAVGGDMVEAAKALSLGLSGTSRASGSCAHARLRPAKEKRPSGKGRLGDETGEGVGCFKYRRRAALLLAPPIG